MSKRRITTEQLVLAIRQRQAGEGSYKSIAAELGINWSTFRSYVVRYESLGISGIMEAAKNNVYTTETKIKAVKAYLKGEGSLRVIAGKYGLRSDKQLQSWIKMYNSGIGFRQKMSGGSRMNKARPTTVEERVEIAKDCIANGGNYGETALKYKVSYQQVYQWTKKFKEMGAAGLEDRRGKRKKDQTPRTELEKAQIEIERLKHELYMTQMERDLLKKLDEIERREACRK